MFKFSFVNYLSYISAIWRYPSKHPSFSTSFNIVQKKTASPKIMEKNTCHPFPSHFLVISIHLLVAILQHGQVFWIFPKVPALPLADFDRQRWLWRGRQRRGPPVEHRKTPPGERGDRQCRRQSIGMYWHIWIYMDNTIYNICIYIIIYIYIIYMVGYFFIISLIFCVHMPSLELLIYNHIFF